MIMTTNILFVGNLQLSLEQVEDKIANFLPKDIDYRILTYKKTDIFSSNTYEDFILDNYEYINDYPLSVIEKKYQDVNLYLAFVSERFISNYYYGIENTLGNKNLNYDEIMFLLKSFVLFLESHIEKCEIVFSGYADNFMSTITYYLCEHYKKKCIAFHEISVIDSNSNFLIEGIYAKPYQDLIINKGPKSYSELVSFMDNYDGIKDRDERFEKNATMKKGLFGVFSPNILDLSYLKFSLFGYQVIDSRTKIYLNLNKPSPSKKIKANLYRLFNRFIVSSFVTKSELNEIKGIKCIYFPLQVQPEASTSSRVPFYMNQLAMIENISKSLPLGYKLITKEHPLAIGMNEFHFYKKINMIPNVELMNNNASGKELIKRSDLIISFGGTTLFESILEGKKILMLLPDYTYSDSKLIFKVKDQNNLYPNIVEALGFTISEEEIQEEKEKMLNFFYQRGFPRFVDFEKNIADNLIKIYEMEKNNE